MASDDVGSPEHLSLLQQMRLVDAVMRRIDARAKLQSLASDVLKGLEAVQPHAGTADKFVGELTPIASRCSDVKPGQSITFVCSESKSLLASFNCGDAGLPSFNCNSNYINNPNCEPTFKCDDKFDCNNGATVSVHFS